jgi:hypothetical protein
MRSILVSYKYKIYRTTVRENCSILSVKYDIVLVMSINGSCLKVHTSEYEWPRMTKSDHEWPRVTTNDHKWQRMTTIILSFWRKRGFGGRSSPRKLFHFLRSRTAILAFSKANSQTNWMQIDCIIYKNGYHFRHMITV